MSDSNEDKTLAFQDQTAFDSDKLKSGSAAVIDVPKARLTCLDSAAIEGTLPGDGIIHLIPGSEQTVGRGETCTYPIPSRKLSRQHARVFAGVGSWGIEDLNSTNGVQVNRQKIKTAWLTHGDEVRFGPIPFRFELERPDLAAAALAHRPAPVDDGDEERTMMVGSLGAGRAVIEAGRQAAPPIEEITPLRHRESQKAEPLPLARGSVRLMLWLIVGGVAVGLAVAGGFYGPAFVEAQAINQVVAGGSAVADKVIARAREQSGAVAAVDPKYQADIELLSAKEHDIWDKLQQKPGNASLASIYAKIRFLSFERNFASQLSPKKEDANFQGAAGDAERIARDLKSQLGQIERQLPPSLPAAEKADLTSASALADLALVVVTLRRFGHDYRQVEKPVPGSSNPTPNPRQLDEAEKRRNDFNQLRKANIQALSRDYRLFYGIVQDVENKDIALISRWREMLQH